jgi:hypothetical protein
MIFSVNSDPSAGYYTFLIQSEEDTPKKYQEEQQRYRIVPLSGNGPWNIIAYNGDHPDEVSERWTISDREALLTTANEVPAFL